MKMPPDTRVFMHKMQAARVFCSGIPVPVFFVTIKFVCVFLQFRTPCPLWTYISVLRRNTISCDQKPRKALGRIQRRASAQ